VTLDSTGSPSPRKASQPRNARRPKPPKNFPLRVHKGTGYWCKKVRGRVFYFGKVADDPNGTAALDAWLKDKDDLLAGREPRVRSEGLTVEELCFRFLAHHEERRNNGELNPRTYQGYFATAEAVAKALGRTRVVADLVPDDFRKLRQILAKTRGLVSLRNEMQRVRSIFKFAFDEGLVAAPVRFGKGFDKPKLDAVSREREAHRAEHGDRMFEAADIHRILAAASQPLKAMVLLAANSGFGQSDLAALPLRALDLESGWLDFARVKTAVRRRVPLWPETVRALREWLPLRPRAKDPADGGLLFLTVRGARWVKVSKSGAPKDAIGQEFGKVLNNLGLKRPGVAFYALRHGFETVAGETADQIAVDAIMGHKTPGMSAVYRERIGDDRLRKVADHVRAWLFPPPAGDDTTPRARAERELRGGRVVAREPLRGPSAPESNPENCDPVDPCDPAQENMAKSGADGSVSIDPGLRPRVGGAETAGSIAGSIENGGATPENPTKTCAGPTGSTGSQFRGPSCLDASPRLRLYVG
jgi:integrase